MKNTISTTIALLFSMVLFGQSNDVCLKIGGSYFINCERTVAFGDYSILTVSGNDKTGRMVNFDLYGADGTMQASLLNGNFSGKQADDYQVQRFEEGFFIKNTVENRIVLKIQSVENKEEKRTEMHVWADFYLPNGGVFQCTPEESNVPLLEMIKGTTMKKAGTGVQLN